MRSLGTRTRRAGVCCTHGDGRPFVSRMSRCVAHQRDDDEPVLSIYILRRAYNYYAYVYMYYVQVYWRASVYIKKNMYSVSIYSVYVCVYEKIPSVGVQRLYTMGRT